MESTKPPLTFSQIQINYEKCIRLAVSILVCNYAGLNQAIDMGLDRERHHHGHDHGQDHILLSPKVQMTELCEMVGGPILKKASSVDLTKRILLIDAIVELLLADTIEAQDIEDLIDDYMELNFHTKCEEIDDHLEIGQILIRLRAELTDCAHNDKDMNLCTELQQLVEFNLKNHGKLEDIERLAKEQISDLISESSGFESICGDSVCESYNGSDDDSNSDEEGQKPPKLMGPIDDDGFEEVVSKKRR